MAHATYEYPEHIRSALQRVWALIASALDLLGDPARASELNRLLEKTERLLAHLFFIAAARIAGRTDLLETHEAYLHRRGGAFEIRVRPKLGALHPYQQIIFAKLRAVSVARYRRALGRRSRFSRKISYLHFRNQRRKQGAVSARRRKRCASPSHTPARIDAPP